MGQLFDKSTDALRETFVRARLSEPAMFGRADIEAWLDRQQHPILSTDDGDPWFARRLADFLDATWDAPDSTHEVMGRMIDEHLTPLAEPPDWYLRDQYRHRPDQIRTIGLLVAGGAKAYYPVRQRKGRVPILRVGRDTFSVDLPDEENADKFGRFAGLRRTRSAEFFHLLLDEYLGGRPKAASALSFLKEEYQAAVRLVRETAERDFDEAVAVSADGTKIVTTRWVIVTPLAPGDPATLYPAVAFRGNKIRRAPNQDPDGKRCFARVQIGSLVPLADPALGTDIKDAQAFDVCAGSFRRARGLGLYTQFMIRFDERVVPDVESVFLVSADDCPSPLPEGGRKLSV